MTFYEMLEHKQFIIIDDDATTLFYTSAVIKKFFFYNQVISFKDPSKAVGYFENVFIAEPCESVVLLDINMPELSGWDVLDRLQMLPHIVKEKLLTLIVSSSIDPQDKIKGNEYSLVSAYIEKPFSIKKLKDVMDLRQSVMIEEQLVKNLERQLRENIDIP
jgi:response regulator RpfG family c-di-GMP phosphodiesterase